MITARCKFVVRSVKSYEGDHSRDVILETQYDDTLPEDKKFSKATPSGKMEVVISNPNVYDVFKPGNKVYIDVTVIE